MTPILFVPETLGPDQELSLSKENTHYLAQVLRLRTGDRLLLHDATGARWNGRVQTIQRRAAIVRVTDRRQIDTESPLRITLAQGLLKGQKMDWVVQKATELGVTEICPVITERSEARRQDRRERWLRIAQSATAQCGRSRVPELRPPSSLEGFMKSWDGPGIFFWEAASEPLHASHLADDSTGKIVILVGPEGGFSEDEARRAEEKGFQQARLGPRILRAETGAITALTLVQYLFGDLGTANRPPDGF